MEFFEKRKKLLEGLTQEMNNAVIIKKAKIQELEKELNDLERDRAKLEGRIAEVDLLNKSFTKSAEEGKSPAISSGIIEGADLKKIIEDRKKAASITSGEGIPELKKSGLKKITKKKGGK